MLDIMHLLGKELSEESIFALYEFANNFKRGVVVQYFRQLKRYAEKTNDLKITHTIEVEMNQHLDEMKHAIDGVNNHHLFGNDYDGYDEDEYDESRPF